MEEKTMYIGIALVAIVIVIAGLAVMTPQNENTTYNLPNNVPNNMPSDEMVKEMEEEMMQASDNIRVIEVDGNEFRFTPGEIKVNKGERVRVIFRNTGNLPHDFVIEGTSLRTRIIQPGETDTIEFTAQETKTYTFYCSVGSHRQQGMEGSLEIA